MNHRQRVDVLGALVVTPGGRRIRLRTMSHTVNVNGKYVLAFLQRLLAQVRAPAILLWDNAPVHKRKLVQDFIASRPRLHVYPFPSYAPELNPVEFVWTQAEEHLSGRAPRNLTQLKCYVHAAIQRTRASQRRLRACLHGADLNWKNTSVKYLFKSVALKLNYERVSNLSRSCQCKELPVEQSR